MSKERCEYDEEAYDAGQQQYEVDTRSSDRYRHDSKSSFFPLGFLLVTLVLGILAAIAGLIILSAGSADLGLTFIGVGTIVAMLSFLFGVLESL